MKFWLKKPVTNWLILILQVLGIILLCKLILIIQFDFVIAYICCTDLVISIDCVFLIFVQNDRKSDLISKWL